MQLAPLVTADACQMLPSESRLRRGVLPPSPLKTDDTFADFVIML
jgi:hypothetical protein